MWRSHNYSLCIQPWDLKTRDPMLNWREFPRTQKSARPTDLWLWLGNAPKFYDRFPIRLGKLENDIFLHKVSQNFQFLYRTPITPNLNHNKHQWQTPPTSSCVWGIGTSTVCSTCSWRARGTWTMTSFQSCADPLHLFPVRGNIWTYYQWEMWKVVVSKTLEFTGRTTYLLLDLSSVEKPEGAIPSWKPKCEVAEGWNRLYRNYFSKHF